MKIFNSVWFKGLDALEKVKMQETLANSSFLLDKLRKIVYNIRVEREKVSTADYDCPSWSHKQAHNNGFDEAIRTLEKILNETDRERTQWYQQ